MSKPLSENSSSPTAIDGPESEAWQPGPLGPAKPDSHPGSTLFADVSAEREDPTTRAISAAQPTADPSRILSHQLAKKQAEQNFPAPNRLKYQKTKDRSPNMKAVRAIESHLRPT
jgi:hypothetical protein